MSGAAAPAPNALGAGLKAAAFLIATVLLAVFLLPRTPERDAVAPSAVERQRLLRFADRDDGSVVVTDAGSGLPVATLTGQQGFFRGTVSGLTRIRGVEHIGAEPPFRLTLYANRRLVLDDPATGKVIELEAFGPTNKAVFAGLLEP